MITSQIASALLLSLEKAVMDGTIKDLVREDLEPEAYNSLWHASSPEELTALKMLPSTEATKTLHEFDVITSYGEQRGYGVFGETTLPKKTNPTFVRKSVQVKLIGEMSETYLLPSLQKTIKVEGQTNAAAISRSLLMLNLLRKKNKGLYFLDTSRTRLGADGLAFKGIIQQIREGTDGTTGTSPFGSHVIDMEGAALTVDNLRAKITRVLTLFGYITCFIMDPFVRADFEATLDASTRLPMPTGIRPLVIGLSVAGIQTGAGQQMFHSDNALGPLARGNYTGTMEEGAPIAAPTGTAVFSGSPSGSNVSKFNAGDAGGYFWIVTEVKNDRESLGRRFPTASVQAVTAGGEEAFNITPNDPMSDYFRVYRGITGEADTDASFAFEVANSGGGGPVEFFDLNHYRPRTSVALALALHSDVQRFLAEAPDGRAKQYAAARASSTDFLGQKDSPQNTVCVASLGPTMGMLRLADILPTVDRPLYYSALTPEVRNPLHNLAFINIGSATFANA